MFTNELDSRVKIGRSWPKPCPYQIHAGAQPERKQAQAALRFGLDRVGSWKFRFSPPQVESLHYMALLHPVLHHTCEVDVVARLRQSMAQVE